MSIIYMSYTQKIEGIWSADLEKSESNHKNSKSQISTSGQELRHKHHGQLATFVPYENIGILFNLEKKCQG